MNNLRIIDAAEVRRLAPMATAIEALRQAFIDQARHPAAEQHPRGIYRLHRDRDDFGVVMPSTHPGVGFGVKLSTVMPGNLRHGRSTIHSVYVLFHPETGEPSALMDGAEITRIRTAATSAISVDLLAPAHATRLAVIGAGVQARAHVEAVRSVRPIDSIRIHSRTPSRAEEMRAEIAALGFDGEVVVTSLDDAVREADIICAATSTADPQGFIHADGLRPHVHICSIGGRTLEACELQPSTLRKLRVHVDDVQSALAESGELRAAVACGDISVNDITPLGTLLRAPAQQLRELQRVRTCFRSVGIALQDAAIASLAAARRPTGEVAGHA